MNLGPIAIVRRRRTGENRIRALPWETLTISDLSYEARMIIAKMARASAKDFFTELADYYSGTQLATVVSCQACNSSYPRLHHPACPHAPGRHRPEVPDEPDVTA